VIVQPPEWLTPPSMCGSLELISMRAPRSDQRQPNVMLDARCVFGVHRHPRARAAGAPRSCRPLVRCTNQQTPPSGAL